MSTASSSFLFPHPHAMSKGTIFLVHVALVDLQLAQKNCRIQLAEMLIPGPNRNQNVSWCFPNHLTAPISDRNSSKIPTPGESLSPWGWSNPKQKPRQKCADPKVIDVQTNQGLMEQRPEPFKAEKKL